MDENGLVQARALNAETIPVIALTTLMLRDLARGETSVVVVIDTMSHRPLGLVNRAERWHFRHWTSPSLRIEYTPTSCFETFPFPHPTDAQRTAVADAAKALNGWRHAWLNPKDDGLGMTTAEKNKRTLTNLYNQRPAWLDNAHAVLDAAVFEAYGWPTDITDQELLARLLALNLEREPA